MSIIFAPWREIDPEQQRTKQIKKKEGTNTSLLTCTENYFAFLSNWYTKMCGNLGEIPGTFSCSKSVAYSFAVEGYYLHLQKSEDQAQPKSCRCDTKSSQKVSTILVNTLVQK